MQKLLIAISIAFGLLIAYVDSRPNWDDTGITAVAIFAACFLFAAFDPVRPGFGRCAWACGYRWRGSFSESLATHRLRFSLKHFMS
jgi:hypothetical protein